MNEAETRAEHIDPALKAAGWGVVEGSRISREFPITQGRLEGLGRRGKALSEDYVLIYRNHKLAVVEAKAWNEAVSEGVAQAKNYAAKVAVVLPTPPMARAFMPLIWHRAKRKRWLPIPRRQNCGR